MLAKGSVWHLFQAGCSSPQNRDLPVAWGAWLSPCRWIIDNLFPDEKARVLILVLEGLDGNLNVLCLECAIC